MTDFTVDIKCDASPVEAGLAKVRTQLDRTTVASKQAEAAIAKAVKAGEIPAEKTAEAVRQLTRELIGADRAAAQAAASLSKVGSQGMFGGLKSEIGAVQSLAGGVGGLVGGLGIGVGISQVTQFIGGVMHLREVTQQLEDGYKLIENRLRSATNTQLGFNSALEGTRHIADATNTAIEPTVALFSRLTNATRSMGVSQERVLDVVGTTNRLLQQGGASAQEQGSAILQLSQAFGSGRLAGEEFNAVNEAAPNLIKVFADSMGVATGAMKDLASQGKVTSADMFTAIENMSTKAAFEAERLAKTREQLLQPLANELKTNPDRVPRIALEFAPGGSTAADIGVAAKVSEGILELSGYTNDSVNALEKFNSEIGNTLSLVNKLHTAMGGKSGGKGSVGVVSALADFGTQIGELVNYVDPAAMRIRALEQQLQHLEQRDKTATAEGLRLAGAVQSLSDTAGTAASSLLAMGRGLASSLLPKFFDNWAGGIDKVSTALSPLEKLYRSIVEPVRDFRRDQALLGVLLKTNKIDADQYTAALLKMIAALSDADKARAGVGVKSVLGSPSGIGPESALAYQLRTSAPTNDNLAMANMGAAGGSPSEMAGGADYWTQVAAEQQASAAQRNAVDLLDEKSLEKTEGAVRSLAKQTKEWQSQTEGGAKALEAVFGSLENAIVQFALTGKMSFEDLINSMVAALTRLAAQQFFASLLGLASPASGAATAVGAGIASGMSASQANEAAYGGAHATGGSYRAAMTGGAPDSIPVMFHMSPGELATFTPQGQPMGGSAANGNTVIHNRTIVQYDKRALLDEVDTHDGRRVVSRVSMRRRRRG